MIFSQILIFVMGIVLFIIINIWIWKTYQFKCKKKFFPRYISRVYINYFLITIIHFFFKLNLFISILIFIFGILFFFIKKISSLRFIKVANIYYLIIILLLVPIFLSQKYHEDFGYYHLPYAIGFIEEKIIFGFANIDQSFVYNSIWLNLYSIFFLTDKNFDFLTLPSFLIYLCLILFSFHQILSKNEKSNSDYFLLILLFYFILKFTRISEFGVDLPASIFSVLTIYYFIKFFEINLKRERQEYFFLISIFAIFAILIKLSTIPVIFLPIFLYLKYFKDLNFEIFRLKFLFIYFLFITFLIQQFIFTGCIFFPSNLTCLNVSWFSEDNINLSKQLELINKSYSSIGENIITPKEYLKNYNWFSYWLKRNYVEILEHLLTIALPIILFLFFQKKKTDYKLVFNDKLGLYLFLTLGLLFWLSFSPVYRFAIYLFLTLVFVIFVSNLKSRGFSKRVFIIFIFTFVFFSCLKNITRLTKVDKVFLGVLKIDNKYILSDQGTNQLRKIYHPNIKKNLKNGWQGRLLLEHSIYLFL